MEREIERVKDTRKKSKKLVINNKDLLRSLGKTKIKNGFFKNTIKENVLNNSLKGDRIVKPRGSSMRIYRTLKVSQLKKLSTKELYTKVRYNFNKTLKQQGGKLVDIGDYSGKKIYTGKIKWNDYKLNWKGEKVNVGFSNLIKTRGEDYARESLLNMWNIAHNKIGVYDAERTADFVDSLKKQLETYDETLLNKIDELSNKIRSEGLTQSQFTELLSLGYITDSRLSEENEALKSSMDNQDYVSYIVDKGLEMLG